MLFKKIGERKEEDDKFLRKKAEGKSKQCYHNDTCKATVLPVNCLDRDIKKRILNKYLIFKDI